MNSRRQFLGLVAAAPVLANESVAKPGFTAQAMFPLEDGGFRVTDFSFDHKGNLIRMTITLTKPLKWIPISFMVNDA